MTQSETNAGPLAARVPRLGIAICLAGTVFGAWAAGATNPPEPSEKIPRQIPYRGILDLNGAPAPSGTVPMKFELFTNPQSAKREAALWSDSPNVPVQDGQFSAALGDDPRNPIPATAFKQPSLYLQVTVNGQLLAGRQRLLTVPYAQFSGASASPPVGTIVAWLADELPDGWRICNGDYLSTAEYPRLYQVLGTKYGGGADTFRLPDLRGTFLRGLDLGAQRDADGANRTLGSSQGDSTRLPNQGLTAATVSLTHSHAYVDGYFAEFWCHDRNDGVRGTGSKGDSDNSICERWMTTAQVTQDHVHAVYGGDAETRPANVAVNWIMKVSD
jgi:hypothetical protein